MLCLERCFTIALPVWFCRIGKLNGDMCVECNCSCFILSDWLLKLVHSRWITYQYRNNCMKPQLRPKETDSLTGLLSYLLSTWCVGPYASRTGAANLSSPCVNIFHAYFKCATCSNDWQTQHTVIFLRKAWLLKRHNVSWWIDLTKRNYYQIDLKKQSHSRKDEEHKITKISE